MRANVIRSYVIRYSCRLGVTLLLLLATVSEVTLAAGGAQFRASGKANVLSREQPLQGEIWFRSHPQIDKPCTVSVTVSSVRALEERQVFRLVRAESYPMSFAPDSSVWSMPIDSGATHNFAFVFTPELVGLHRFGLAKRVGQSWQQLAALALAIDEDGQVICFGAADSCLVSVVPPHPRRQKIPALISFPIDPFVVQRSMDRHFAAEFAVTPAAKLKDTSFIDFHLECFVPLYQKVQFYLEHSTNVAVRGLPPSWGDSAGPAPAYRHYRGRIPFVTLKTGLTYFRFKMTGTYPYTYRSERANTEFSFYLVTGEKGELLFLGPVNPFARFVDSTDTMLGSLTQLLAVTNRDYPRTRTIQSLPDYLGEEVAKREGADTTAVSDTTRR